MIVENFLKMYPMKILQKQLHNLQGVLGVTASENDLQPEPSYPEGAGDMEEEDIVLLDFSTAVENSQQLGEEGGGEAELDGQLDVGEGGQQRNGEEEGGRGEQPGGEEDAIDGLGELRGQLDGRESLQQLGGQEDAVDVAGEQQHGGQDVFRSWSPPDVIDISDAFQELEVSPPNPPVVAPTAAYIPIITSPGEGFRDPYPTMVCDGPGVYSLPGRSSTITIRPTKGECSVCGSYPPKSARWCGHLISAGFKMGMKMGTKIKTKVSLTKLQMTQRDQKGRSGKKKPRPRDYTEVEIRHDSEEDGEEPLRRRGGVSLLEEVKKSLTARQRCNCDGCRRPR